MYPHIDVVYCDENINLKSGICTKPRWLMLDKQILLIAEDNTIYKHNNVIKLMSQLHYLLYVKHINNEE